MNQDLTIEEAVAYVRLHGGYIRPLFAGSIGHLGIPLLPALSQPSVKI